MSCVSWNLNVNCLIHKSSLLPAESKPYPRVLYLEDTLNSLLQVEANGHFHGLAAISPGNRLPLPNG